LYAWVGCAHASPGKGSSGTEEGSAEKDSLANKEISMSNKPVPPGGDPNTEIDAILYDFNKTKASLALILKELGDEESNIQLRIAAAHRAKPTPEEDKQLDKIIERRDAIKQDIRVLARTTEETLAKNAQVAALGDSLKKLNAGLKRTLDDLKRDVKFADTAKQATAFLDRTLSGLTRLGLFGG
jgi:hypothetical protein